MAHMNAMSKLVRALQICIIIQSSLVKTDYTAHRRSVNVGTVLFRQSDVLNNCWTFEDIYLLNSRRLMQNLLPTKLSDFDRHASMCDFNANVRRVLEDIRENKSEQLMIYALGDTIGGYLRTYVLPATKQLYYSGSLSYNDTVKLFDLYEDVKLFLNTNGEGWAKPNRISFIDNQLPSLNIQHENDDNACDDFITSGNDNINPNLIDIPMPYLDDARSPQSITLPIKPGIAHNLHSPSSAYVVQSYYLECLQCLQSQHVNQADILSFSNTFETWLLQSVLPHLNDETLYPAFGGVFRILATIRRLRKKRQLRKPRIYGGPGGLYTTENIFSPDIFDISKQPGGPEMKWSTNGEWSSGTSSYRRGGGDAGGRWSAGGKYDVEGDGGHGSEDSGGSWDSAGGWYPEISDSIKGWGPKGGDWGTGGGDLDEGWVSRRNGGLKGQDRLEGEVRGEFKGKEGYAQEGTFGGKEQTEERGGGPKQEEDFGEDKSEQKFHPEEIPEQVKEELEEERGGGLEHQKEPEERRYFVHGDDYGEEEEGGEEEGEEEEEEDNSDDSNHEHICKHVHVTPEEESNEGPNDDDEEFDELDNSIKLQVISPESVFNSLPCIIASLLISPDLIVLTILFCFIIWLCIAIIFMIVNHEDENLYLREEPCRENLYIDYIAERRKREEDRKFRVNFDDCPSESRKKIYSDVKEGAGAYSKYFYTCFCLFKHYIRNKDLNYKLGGTLPICNAPWSSDAVDNVNRKANTTSNYTLVAGEDSLEQTATNPHDIYKASGTLGTQAIRISSEDESEEEVDEK